MPHHPLPQPILYQRLGVDPWASGDTIRRSYRLLSKRYHPDTSPLHPDEAVRHFQDLQEAYAVLSNPVLRASYDATLWRPVLTRSSEASTEHRHPRATAPEVDDIPTFRPLSSGELFVLVLFASTFVCCLGVVALIYWFH